MQGKVTDALNLFAASGGKNHFSNKTRQVVAGCFLRKLVIGGLAAIASVGLADRVNATYYNLDYVPASMEVKFYDAFQILHRDTNRADRLSAFVDNMGFGCAGQFTTVGRCDRWCGYCNPGDYIDRVRYYCLDKGQYYYLDRRQYNLLGGRSYLLGHPCYPLWHGFYWWRRVAREWVYFYGRFTIFGEPAQPGDVLRAFIAGDGHERIRVGEFTVSTEGWYGDMRVFGDIPLTAYKEGALPNEMITFEAWDENAESWFPTEILYGLPIWTSHGARIRVDVNAIPEPSTIGFLGLGALGVWGLGNITNKRRDREALQK